MGCVLSEQQICDLIDSKVAAAGGGGDPDGYALVGPAEGDLPNGDPYPADAGDAINFYDADGNILYSKPCVLEGADGNSINVEIPAGSNPGDTFTDPATGNTVTVPADAAAGDTINVTFDGNGAQTSAACVGAIQQINDHEGNAVRTKTAVLHRSLVIGEDHVAGATGVGAADFIGVSATDSDDGNISGITTHHLRKVSVSVNGTASNAKSAVIASEGSTSSGIESANVATLNSEASGRLSFVAASFDVQATATRSAGIASRSISADGDRTAAVASSTGSIGGLLSAAVAAEIVNINGGRENAAVASVSTTITGANRALVAASDSGTILGGTANALIATDDALIDANQTNVIVASALSEIVETSGAPALRNGIYSSQNALIDGPGAQNSIISSIQSLSGQRPTIQGANRAAVIATEGGQVLPTHNQAAVIGGIDIQSVQANCVHMPCVWIDPSSMPTGPGIPGTLYCPGGPGTPVFWS